MVDVPDLTEPVFDKKDPATFNDDFDDFYTNVTKTLNTVQEGLLSMGFEELPELNKSQLKNKLNEMANNMINDLDLELKDANSNQEKMEIIKKVRNQYNELSDTQEFKDFFNRQISHYLVDRGLTNQHKVMLDEDKLIPTGQRGVIMRESKKQNIKKKGEPANLSSSSNFNKLKNNILLVKRIMKITNTENFKKSQLQDYINKQKKKGELNSDDLQLQKALKNLFSMKELHELYEEVRNDADELNTQGFSDYKLQKLKHNKNDKKSGMGVLAKEIEQKLIQIQNYELYHDFIILPDKSLKKKEKSLVNTQEILNNIKNLKPRIDKKHPIFIGGNKRDIRKKFNIGTVQIAEFYSGLIELHIIPNLFKESDLKVLIHYLKKNNSKFYNKNKKLLGNPKTEDEIDKIIRENLDFSSPVNVLFTIPAKKRVGGNLTGVAVQNLIRFYK
jgi:hypothetical protein